MPTVYEIFNCTISNNCSPLLDLRPQIVDVYFASYDYTHIPKKKNYPSETDVFRFQNKMVNETLEQFAQRNRKTIFELWQLWKNDEIILEVNLPLYRDAGGKNCFPYKTFESNGKHFFSVDQINIASEWNWEANLKPPLRLKRMKRGERDRVEKLYDLDEKKRWEALKWPIERKCKHAVDLIKNEFDLEADVKYKLRKQEHSVCLSQEYYLVVETIGLDEEKVVVRIKQAKEYGLLELNKSFSFLVNGNEMDEFELFKDSYKHKDDDVIDELDRDKFRGANVKYKHRYHYKNEEKDDKHKRKFLLPIKLDPGNDDRKKQWQQFFMDEKNEGATYLYIQAEKHKSCEKDVIYNGIKNQESDELSNNWPNKDDNWVKLVNIPLYLQFAMQEKGVREFEGKENNSRISEYFNSTNMKADENTRWCGAFVNWCFTQAKRKSFPGGTLSTNWRDKWPDGEKVDEPYLGSLVIIENRAKGHRHVGFVTGRDSIVERDGKKKERIAVLGGNQGGPDCNGQGIMVSNGWRDLKKEYMSFSHPIGEPKIPLPEQPVTPVWTDETVGKNNKEDE